MSEFTGERVIPGQVELDLWNEHIARYALAATFAADRRVLDLGCGTGYGAAELSRTARSVLGLDIAPEATAYAQQRFPLPNVRFITAPAQTVPQPDAAFDLITAFEVIEHVSDWKTLLTETHRLLSPEGIALISTPNKDYYTESRGAGGENPYHVHEFQAAEFRSELAAIYDHVTILQQNRSEAFVFYPAKTYLPVQARLESSGGEEEAAHFFIGICSKMPIPELRSFIYVPRAANVLREREHHIALLETQLDQARNERDHVLAELQKQKDHLEQQNRWALSLEQEWRTAQHRIVQLQDESVNQSKAYEHKIRDLEDDIRQKVDWALETDRRLTAEILDLRNRFAETLQRLESAEATVVERTQWALDLQSKLQHAEAQLAGAKASRWIRTGRMFGVGPDL